jgi:hypothetical protein
MTTQAREQGQRKQEEACAQTFLRWLGCQYGTDYELQRAEECPELKGRWDFVARVEGHRDWLALEIKGLVVPQSLRQFDSWSKFAKSVTKELHARRTIHGSFAICPGFPWKFNQKQSKILVKAFVDALTEVSSNQVDLGPVIASKFSEWPTKPPRSDPELWRGQHVYKIIHPPEELLVVKLDDTDYSVEIWASVSQVFMVDQALDQAVLGIFDPDVGKGAKPNEQLREARQKGASETVLLLDSHIRWKPNTVTQVLNGIDKALISDIDAVYLVSVTNNRVKRVWPLAHRVGSAHQLHFTSQFPSQE